MHQSLASTFTKQLLERLPSIQQTSSSSPNCSSHDNEHTQSKVFSDQSPTSQQTSDLSLQELCEPSPLISQRSSTQDFGLPFSRISMTKQPLKSFWPGLSYSAGMGPTSTVLTRTVFEWVVPYSPPGSPAGFPILRNHHFMDRSENRASAVAQAFKRLFQTSIQVSFFLKLQAITSPRAPLLNQISHTA